MPDLFSPYTLKDVRLKNEFLPDGSPFPGPDPQKARLDVTEQAAKSRKPR